MTYEEKHATVHEAGHVVVALHIGFLVEKIDVLQGFFRTMCDLDAPNWTAEEQYVFLAAGISAETIDLGHFVPAACQDDQKKIWDRKGDSIDKYVPAATQIIKSNQKFFEELRRKIATQLIVRKTESAFVRVGNSFCLLTHDEIQQIWEKWRPSKRE